MSEINREKWLAALAEADVGIVEQHSDAVTIKQFAREFHMGGERAKRLLVEMEHQGKARLVTRITRDGAGRWTKVRAWALT